MSRIASKAVLIPSGVTVKITDNLLEVKSSSSSQELILDSNVSMVQEDGQLCFKAKESKKQSVAMAGTTRALVQNMITGVSKGFNKKLTLVGVGYRAQVKGTKLTLALGYSHNVEYSLPSEVIAKSLSPTEIELTSPNKQMLGQVAAEIRSFRKPEPYKGKGIRYSDERVRRKEAKKK